MAGGHEGELQAAIVHPVHLRVHQPNKELVPTSPQGNGCHSAGELGAAKLPELWGPGGLQDEPLPRAEQEVPRGEELDAHHALGKFVLRGTKLFDQGSRNADLLKKIHTFQFPDCIYMYVHIFKVFL